MQNQKANRTAQDPTAASTHVKETYVKPEAEIVKLELEQPILNGSGDGNGPDFGNGNRGNRPF